MLQVSALHYSTGMQKLEGIWMLASACVLSLPNTHVQVFLIMESRSSEVNLRQSVALMEVSIEVRLKLE